MTWMRPPARNPHLRPVPPSSGRPLRRSPAAGRVDSGGPRGSLDTPRPGSARMLLQPRIAARYRRSRGRAWRPEAHPLALQTQVARAIEPHAQRNGGSCSRHLSGCNAQDIHGHHHDVLMSRGQAAARRWRGSSAQRARSEAVQPCVWPLPLGDAGCPDPAAVCQSSRRLTARPPGT